jgi:hypothetical protein
MGTGRHLNALKKEVKHLTIEATLIVPGYFLTDLLMAGNKVVTGKVIKDLNPVMEPLRQAL